MRVSSEGRDALKRKDLQARFLAKVRSTPKDDCWIWTGGRSGGNGYGTLRDENGAVDYAHRLSHRIHKGPIPPGKKVLHTCDCRKCVNPKHVYVGTHADNVADAIERERYIRRGKLRPAQVMEIVAESRMQGRSWSKLTGIKTKSKTKRAPR